ncbi:MAG: hypothetical protein JRN18_00315 [Nitrososphaerota archaeon]|jgi:hypothetical protein|nr:hypothetical protein [Nitrososphaerota archaeon]
MSRKETESEDDRQVLPRSERVVPAPGRGTSSLEPPLRAFLELSLGLPVFGMEIEVLDLLLKASQMPFGSLLWTSFVVALPFEAGWLALTLRRSMRSGR